MVYGASGYPPKEGSKCTDNIIRLHGGPWKSDWDKGPNPEYPKEGDEKQHVCNPYVLNTSCAALTKCVEMVGEALNDCCIPYSAVPSKKSPAEGCNSNCAASWIVKTCMSGLVNRGPKGSNPGDTPKPPGGLVGARPTPGWNAPVPDCIDDYCKKNQTK